MTPLSYSVRCFVLLIHNVFSLFKSFLFNKNKINAVSISQLTYADSVLTSYALNGFTWSV